MIVVHDEYEIELELEEQEVVEVDRAEEKGKVVMCRLNTIVGLTTLGMIKIRGTLQGREVVVLLDCGATHNFISHSRKRVSDSPIEYLQLWYHYGYRCCGKRARNLLWRG